MIPETRLLFSQIESPTTFAACGVASGLSLFKRIAMSLAPVLTLGKLVDRGPHKYEYQTRIAHRAGTLLAERHPVEYAHPADTALAIYLLLLQEVESSYTLGLAAVMYNNSQLCWARQIAQDVLTRQQFVFTPVDPAVK